jgi:hypothetical protein
MKQIKFITYFLTLQRLRTIAHRSAIYTLAFNLSYVYYYTTQICRHQADAIQNHENEHVRGTGQGEARHRKYKKLRLGDGQTYDRTGD